MLIDQYITESYNDDFVPTNEAWITGENENELYQITNEAMESYNCLFENLIFSESIASIQKLNGLDESAEMLLEKTKEGFWKGLKETLIKWKNQIVEFFKKLWASIRVKVKASATALDKAAELIKKNDLTGFTYQGYKWKDSSISTTISNNAKSLVDEFVMAVEIIRDEGKDDLGSKQGKDLEFYIYGQLVKGGTTRASHKEAINHIKEDYGCNTDSKDIISASASDITNMISFLKSFEANKTIREAEKALTENINKSIKEVSALEIKTKEINSAVNAQINGMKATLKAAQSLLGTCISLEKQKYAEYKSAVLAAMHYNNKSK